MTESLMNRVIDCLANRSVQIHLHRCGDSSSELNPERLMELFRTLAFPGLTIENPGDPKALAELLTGAMAQFRDQLVGLACWTLRQSPDASHLNNSAILTFAQSKIGEVLNCLPELIVSLHQDVQAACDGDPACSGPQEVVICYPGFKAAMLYRLSHELYRKNLKLMARMLSEWAHGVTGIDIHPGASIGHHFFIDHGTGVVIGETAHVGNHVKIYQGVTLGALSFTKDSSGRVIREEKRHPTIEDHVVIYAGATVLGGTTVIGHHSVIGGSVWVTTTVAPYSTVVTEKPRLKIRNQNEPTAPSVVDYQI